jgi:uncharacterized membrane protein
MYLLSHVCIKIFLIYQMLEKKIGFSTDRHKKSHAPLPLSLIKSVDKMVSYLIGGVMVSILALSVLDPWDRAPVWSNQRL